MNKPDTDLRVLTTNSYHLIGYSIVQSLRMHASYIALCYNDDRPNDVALSRFVDRVYPQSLPKSVPLKSLQLGLQNADYEENYIGAILSICLKDRIEVIVPTSDYEVYLFAKNRERFQREGILIVGPSFEAVCKTMDKYESVVVAEQSGFPVPRMILPGKLEEAESFAQQVGFPLMVKARFSSGGFGVRYVPDMDALINALNAVKAWAGWPTLQEYIPGTREPSINILMGADGNPSMLFTLRKIRYLSASYSTCICSVDPLPETQMAVEMVRRLGLTGIVSVQTKMDVRDGKHKLIEINPRWGANARIFLRMAQQLGMNPVLLTIQIARGQPSPLIQYPGGYVGISPVEDALAIRKYWRLRPDPRDEQPENASLSWSHLLRSYWSTYIRRNVILDFFFMSLMSDARAVLSAWRKALSDVNRTDVKFVPSGDALFLQEDGRP